MVLELCDRGLSYIKRLGSLKHPAANTAGYQTCRAHGTWCTQSSCPREVKWSAFADSVLIRFGEGEFRYDQDSEEESAGGGFIGYECEYEIINWYQVNPYGDDYYLDSDVYLECRFTEEAPVPEESSPNGGGYVLPSNGNGPNPPQTDEACYDPHPTIPGMVVPCVPYKDDDYKIINNLTEFAFTRHNDIF